MTTMKFTDKQLIDLYTAVICANHTTQANAPTNKHATPEQITEFLGRLEALQALLNDEIFGVAK